MDVGQFNNQYGHKVRLRVCGILVSDDKLLMVKHAPLGPLGYLWSPPGGAVEYGADMKANLKREMHEETNLDAEIGEMLFVNEYIYPPIHAVEVFFKITTYQGEIKTGKDPELPEHDQMIKEVALMPFEILKSLNPLAVHNILRHCNSINDLTKLSGFFKFENYSTN